MADKAARRQRCGEARGLPKANTSRAVSSFGQASGWAAGAGGAGAGLFGGGEERGGELFVEDEEVFDALAVVVEGLRAVTQVHGARQMRPFRSEIVIGYTSSSVTASSVDIVGTAFPAKRSPTIF